MSGGELVPSNHVSLLKIWRLAPESKTQRDKVEFSVGNLIALICVSESSSLLSLRTSQSCFVGVSSRSSYSSSLYSPSSSDGSGTKGGEFFQGSLIHR